MDPSSITLKALSITSDATAANVTNGATTEIHGKAMTTITGGIVKIN
jgi:type VI secretion system secreted protein VgrG